MDSSITIPSENDDNYRKETKEEYWSRIDKSIKDIEDGKGAVLTMDELKEHVDLPHP